MVTLIRNGGLQLLDLEIERRTKSTELIVELVEVWNYLGRDLVRRFLQCRLIPAVSKSVVYLEDVRSLSIPHSQDNRAEG